MKTEYPGVDWLLDCEPRLAQLEALARSYTGFRYRDTRDQEPVRRALVHAGKPAVGWGHFLEMRLGKTPLTFNEFLLFRRDHGIKKLVVFAPSKYKHAWALEAERFGVDVPVLPFESGKKGAREMKAFIDRHSEFIVPVHYEMLQHDQHTAVVADMIDDRTMLAADESVFLKNRSSKTTLQGIELAKAAAIIRPLTGKPTPQGVADLYSQLRFMRKLNGVNFFQFRNKFAVMGGFKGKQIIGIKNEEKLQRLAQSEWYFFARRAEWGTQIDCDYEVAEVEMLSRQQQAYAEMDEEFMTWLDSGEAVTADQIITKHMKLQQISSGFIRDEQGKVHQLVPFDKTPKFVDLRDRLDNYENCKVLIIAHYTPTIDNLIKHLQDFNPAVIRGATGMKEMGLDVETEKARFNTDSRCRIMIAQTKAVKYGHNLMGTPEDPCLATAYFENSYSLDDRAQSEQRNQGEGQLAAIHVTDFVSSPIDRKVVKSLQTKEDVAAVIMGYYKGSKP
jgi:SNF2 family DNA or RNA helicase